MHPGGVLLFIRDFRFLFIVVLVAVEWLQRDKQHGLEFYSGETGRVVRWGVYCLISCSIMFFSGAAQEFIYFAF
jgi:hypothetical protein